MAAVEGVSYRGLLAGLSADHRRWLWINALAIPLLLNAGLSAAAAWLTLRGEHTVPFWSLPLIDPPNLVTDTVGTFFVLPLLTTLSIGLAARAVVRGGQLQPVVLPTAWSALADRLPTHPIRRAGLMAVAVLVALGPVAIAVMALTSFRHGIDPVSFVIYKAVLGVALGAVFTPFIAIVSLSSSQ